jgi:hypothetical protein
MAQGLRAGAATGRENCGIITAIALSLPLENTLFSSVHIKLPVVDGI